MDKITLDKVKELAVDFRTAIKKADIRSVPMDRFPIGCCGEASLYLGEYLRENGFETRFICRFRILEFDNSFPSHAWLEFSDGTIVDITGDQFRHDSEFLNYDISVYVGPPDAFHLLFTEIDSVHSASFKEMNYGSEYDSDIKNYIYEKIKKNIH